MLFEWESCQFVWQKTLRWAVDAFAPHSQIASKDTGDTDRLYMSFRRPICCVKRSIISLSCQVSMSMRVSTIYTHPTTQPLTPWHLLIGNFSYLRIPKHTHINANQSLSDGRLARGEWTFVRQKAQLSCSCNERIAAIIVVAQAMIFSRTQTSKVNYERWWLKEGCCWLANSILHLMTMNKHFSSAGQMRVERKYQKLLAQVTARNQQQVVAAASCYEPTCCFWVRLIALSCCCCCCHWTLFSPIAQVGIVVSRQLHVRQILNWLVKCFMFILVRLPAGHTLYVSLSLSLSFSLWSTFTAYNDDVSHLFVGVAWLSHAFGLD